MKKMLISIFILILPQARANTLCIAHRGNNIDYFENSMASIRSAVELQSDGVEFDVHHTFEGDAILSHDKTLSRLAVSKDGRDCPLKKKLNKLTVFDVKDNCLLKNGEEVPTLRETLAYLEDKDIRIFLELKDVPNLRTLLTVRHFLKERPDRLHIISFKKKALDYIRTMARVLPFFKKVEVMRLEVFFHHPKDEYNPSVRYTKKHLKRLEKASAKYNTGVWTVDDEDKMINVFEAGISYMTTNNPRLCLELKDLFTP